MVATALEALPSAHAGVSNNLGCAWMWLGLKTLDYGTLDYARDAFAAALNPAAADFPEGEPTAKSVAAKNLAMVEKAIAEISGTRGP